jgi:hypothetical protein
MFGAAVAAVMLVAGELYLVRGQIRRKLIRSLPPSSHPGSRNSRHNLMG